MSEESPTVFGGRYELHRRLARGGMADVFLVTNLDPVMTLGFCLLLYLAL